MYFILVNNASEELKIVQEMMEIKFKKKPLLWAIKCWFIRLQLDSPADFYHLANHDMNPWILTCDFRTLNRYSYFSFLVQNSNSVGWVDRLQTALDCFKVHVLLIMIITVLSTTDYYTSILNQIVITNCFFL